MLTGLTQTTFQRSGGPNQYSYQWLKDKAWEKLHNTEISETTHQLGKTTEKRDTEHGKMFRRKNQTRPAVWLKSLFEENNDTGAQIHKNHKRLLCNRELEVGLCCCLYKAGFWWDFWRVSHKQTPRGKVHIHQDCSTNAWDSSWKISSNTCMSGARDVFLIKRHSTHTHTFMLHLCLREIHHPTTSHLKNWDKLKSWFS